MSKKTIRLIHNSKGQCVLCRTRPTEEAKSDRMKENRKEKEKNSKTGFELSSHNSTRLSDQEQLMMMAK